MDLDFVARLAALEQRVSDFEALLNQVEKKLGSLDSSALNLVHDVDVLKEIAFKGDSTPKQNTDVISYPMVAEKIINIIVSLYDLGEVDVYDSIAYLDLEELYTRGVFPEDYTPEFMRECLRKARVTRRISRSVRESIGWDKIPAYAIAVQVSV